MGWIRFLAIMPTLQIALIYFGFSGEASRLFFFLPTSIAVGVFTFYLIRKTRKHDRLEWFSFVYSSSIVAGLLAIPLGLWFFLYAKGEGFSAFFFSFLLILAFCMPFYEWYYIFRGIKNM